MKKVLVITYYWPPSGGAGVQRWLKFVKYLRNFGWEPVVYTPENPEAPAVDESLLKDVPQNLTVLKTKIWEPYSVYKKFAGIKSGDKIKTGFLSEKKKPSLIEKLSIRIRGNFFIPDARKFWIKPSIKYLTKYLNENPVDAIVSTGPPHSMHMIALGLKKKLNIPWLADFRDPWTNIDFYDQLKLSAKADKKHHDLEKKVLEEADIITVISETMATDFEACVKREYSVITNGFDEDDHMSAGDVKKDSKFSLVYIGSMNKARNPVSLWKALDEILSADYDFKNDFEMKLIGQIDFSVKNDIEKYGIEKFVTYKEYIGHDEIIRIQMQAGLLLLVINKTPNAKMVVTGKLFEYMASGTPILCIGPEDGDAAKIIRETKSGFVSGFENVEKLKNDILICYTRFKSGMLEAEKENIDKYSRKNLTKKISVLLDSLIK